MKILYILFFIYNIQIDSTKKIEINIDDSIIVNSGYPNIQYMDDFLVTDKPISLTKKIEIQTNNPIELNLSDVPYHHYYFKIYPSEKIFISYNRTQNKYIIVPSTNDIIRQNELNFFIELEDTFKNWSSNRLINSLNFENKLLIHRKRLEERLLFLDNYKKQNIISEKAYFEYKNEIGRRHLNMVFEVLEFSQRGLEALNEKEINILNQVLASKNTPLDHNTTYVLLQYSKIKGFLEFGEFSFKNTFEASLKYLEGENLNYALFRNIKLAIRKKDMSFLKEYENRFYLECRNELLNENIRSILNPNRFIEDKLETLETQTVLTFSDILNWQKGKVVYLNLWASWCKPCREEIPMLQGFQQQYKSKGLEILYISVDKDRKEWEKAMEELVLPIKSSYFLSNGLNSKFANSYSIGGIPAHFLINRDGKIIFSSTEKMTDKELKEKLDIIFK